MKINMEIANYIAVKQPHLKLYRQLVRIGKELAGISSEIYEEDRIIIIDADYYLNVEKKNKLKVARRIRVRLSGDMISDETMSSVYREAEKPGLGCDV